MDGVAVAIPKKLLVLSQVNLEDPVMLLAPFQNVTCPDAAVPVTPPNPAADRQELLIE